MWADLFLDYSWLTQDASVNFKVEFDNLIQRLHLYIIAKVCYLYY